MTSSRSSSPMVGVVAVSGRETVKADSSNRKPNGSSSLISIAVKAELSVVRMSSPNVGTSSRTVSPASSVGNSGGVIDTTGNGSSPNSSSASSASITGAANGADGGAGSGVTTVLARAMSSNSATSPTVWQRSSKIFSVSGNRFSPSLSSVISS